MCDADKFRCKYGPAKYYDNPCIKNVWVNDGIVDCEDGSDETKGLLSTVCTCFSNDDYPNKIFAT